MASNKLTWVRNLYGAVEPLIMLGLFQAGATQAIKRGEILELTGDTNTAWVPIDSDFAMNGHIAIANEEIKAGDRAGYYEIIVPRPGDVFEFELASGAAVAVGAALYYSASQKVTSSGTNILGFAVGQEHYPSKQGHLADDASSDAGTTVRSTSYVRMCFAREVSYLAKMDRYGIGINLGDAGGFSGVKFDAANTTLDLFIDGTQVATVGADGAYTDTVQ